MTAEDEEAGPVVGAQDQDQDRDKAVDAAKTAKNGLEEAVGPVDKRTCHARRDAVEEGPSCRGDGCQHRWLGPCDHVAERKVVVRVDDGGAREHVEDVHARVSRRMAVVGILW